LTQQQEGGNRSSAVTIEEMKGLALENDDLMSGRETVFFVINGFINTVFCGDENNPRPMYYLACSACKKKVIDDNSGYFCERCDKTFQAAVPTYNFAMRVSDFTDGHIFNLMGEAGNTIIGVPADTFYNEFQDQKKLIEWCNSLRFKQVSLLIRAKFEQRASA
jgi:replication factor A1